MSNSNERYGWMSSWVMFCIFGLILGAVGVGLVISSAGVAEPPAEKVVDAISPAELEAVLKLARPPAVPLSAEVVAAAKANGQFAVDLYQRLAETEAGNNLFLSPFSISTVLTMAAEGAVDQTRDQMTNVLHVPNGDLEPIHRGQQGLQAAVVPVVPTEVTKMIASLRAKLKEANARTESLKKTQRYREMHAAAQAGAKLANEINELVSRVSAYELRIANALWLEKTYPIESSFMATVKPNYGAVVFPVDFKKSSDPVRLQINQWVAEQTNDRIQDLLGPGSLSDLTRLVITNTVYFRGDWARPFEPTSTRPESFQVSDSRSVQVPMMHQWNSAGYSAFTGTGDLFPTPHEIRIDLKNDDPSMYPDAKGHTMLALDYQGQKIQMFLLVPQSPTGLADLEKLLTYEKLQRWFGHSERRSVDITIPKFKLEATYKLGQPLQDLGMVRAFQKPGTDAEGAQFDKLSSTQRPDDRLFVSSVVHKTYVDVSEIGTEAAAATALDVVAEGGPDDLPKTRPFYPIFKANKPFLFLIRDRETATILFLGRYITPNPPAAADAL